ncbi:hypothetical protein AAFF_G00130570 [Aldrovandia affinis]|uniref:Uncharacterized protein n=1 Tax=Aldrovandia affinis TaxID=143900 RepID=A0AAD7W9N7_9TELE|nr:hypothetical protein AAFF_G00130570 [Aldrovandia affinis]
MADKQLATVRIQFVAEVGEDVIKQLLDDFLKDGVLNDEEHESLVQENSTRTDQAGCLIDMVSDKGPGASEKLFSRLKERDVNLFNKLSLGSVSPDQSCCKLESSPKLSEQEEKPVSSILKTCTEQKKKDVLEKDGSIYITKKKPEHKRLALLINNINYKKDSLVRLGADKDEERMEKLLKDLHYEVVKRTNLTGKEMNEVLEAFSERKEHKDADSTFVVIMSHGEKDAIHGIDHDAPDKDLFSIDKIYDHLNTLNCQDLSNKPKIIRRVNIDNSHSQSEINQPRSRPEISEKNFIRLMCCSTPETVDCDRDPKEGSLFIQWFVETFNTYAHQVPIFKLFQKVIGRYEKFPENPVMERITQHLDFYL